MTPSEKSSEIASAFMNYHKNGNRSIVESYKKDEIEKALREYHLDRVHPYYKTMEEWCRDLADKEKQKKDRKNEWVDHLIRFILGVIAVVIGKIILDHLTQK